MKRSDRLVALTNIFLENSGEHIALPYFTKKFEASKSSISEDLVIVNRVFHEQGIGRLERIPGASGGVRYIPGFKREDSETFIDSLIETLEDSERILPGGYLYMSDILGDPKRMRQIGRVFASIFSKYDLDAVVTVETKGIPLAYTLASFLNVPVVIVRRDPKVTEGSSVSINYVSGSSKKIQTMVLPKRNLKEGANVCVIDDFMKAGGTITGIVSLLEEFNAKVKAIGVLAEADDEEEDRIIDDYTSLVKITDIDMKQKHIKVAQGNFLKQL